MKNHTFRYHAQNGGRLPVRFAALCAIALTIVFTPIRVGAADLKPETLEIWKEYVQAAISRNERHLFPGNSFLWTDEVAGQAAKLQGGEVVVAPVGSHMPLKVPAGLIHDWVAAAFIPNVNLNQVFLVLRDYGRYKDFYHPNVIDSKLITSGEYCDHFSLLLRNKSVMSKTALDSDYESSYTHLDDQHWYGTSETTRVQEVANYGTPSEHKLPENRGIGLIWRLYSVSRFEERDGVVYVEVEAIALSRDIPVSIRWFVDPIVRRISRGALVTSLEQTEEAVRSSTIRLTRSVGRRACSTNTTCLPNTMPLLALFDRSQNNRTDHMNRSEFTNELSGADRQTAPVMCAIQRHLFRWLSSYSFRDQSILSHSF